MKGEGLRLLVVDDEPLARRHLQSLLERESDVGEVSTARHAREALRLADSPYDAAFLDIEMPGASGLELAERLIAGGTAVVFVTAHAEHAAAAFDLEAADYLLKPFDETRLQRCLQRLRERLAARQNDRAPLQMLAVQSEGRHRLIPVGDVDWIEAQGKQVLLHRRGERLPLRRPLRELEEQLDPQQFARVHRKAMVRIAAIREMWRAFHGDWMLVLHSGEKVLMSRRYRQRLRGVGPL